MPLNKQDETNLADIYADMDKMASWLHYQRGVLDAIQLVYDLPTHSIGNARTHDYIIRRLEGLLKKSEEDSLEPIGGGTRIAPMRSGVTPTTRIRAEPFAALFEQARWNKGKP